MKYISILIFAFLFSFAYLANGNNLDTYLMNLSKGLSQPFTSRELEIFRISSKLMPSFSDKQTLRITLVKDFKFRGLSCPAGFRIFSEPKGNSVIFVVSGKGPNTENHCEYEKIQFGWTGIFDNNFSPIQFDIGSMGHLAKPSQLTKQMSNERNFIGKSKFIDKALDSLRIASKPYYLLSSPIPEDEDTKKILMLESFNFDSVTYPAKTKLEITNVLGPNFQMRHLWLPENSEAKITGVYCSGKVELDITTLRLERCKLSRDQEFDHGIKIPIGTEVAFSEIQAGSSLVRYLASTGPLSKNTVIQGVEFKEGMCVAFDREGKAFKEFSVYPNEEPTGSEFLCPKNPRRSSTTQ